MDPEATKNMRMVIMTFIGQCTADIRKKLKVDGAMTMSLAHLVDIAYKVYNVREE